MNAIIIARMPGDACNIPGVFTTWIRGADMAIVPPAEKTCTRCGALKSASEFYADKRRPGGLTSDCRECVKARSRSWYAHNSAAVSVTVAAYRQAHAEQRRAWDKAYAQANAERLRQASRARYLASRALILEQQRAYRSANAERDRARSKAYREAHAESVSESKKAWKRSHPERVKAAAARWLGLNVRRKRETGAAWRRAHPEYHRFFQARRRASKRNAEGSHTRVEWAALLATYGNRCLACGVQDVRLTEDHIIPLMDGGTDWIENIQPLCKPCNTRKGTRTIDYRPGREV
jgi:5-methylcytosine-specific restriction endonuclease McrA